MRIAPKPWYLRLLVWTLVCGVSAAPSFFFGAMAFEEPGNIVAMLLGVATFIAGYTWVSGTAWSLRLRRKPFVNRTLRLGYWTRIAISIVSIIPPLAIVDIYCGLLSIMFVTGHDDSNATSLQVYLITLVQGTILNIALAVYMCVLWGAQRLVLPLPPSLDEGLCPTCGYDLRASKDVCPECGMRIESATASEAA